jgi:hypothetical protein
MKRYLGYILLVVGAYVLCLIVQLPAAQIYAWMKPRGVLPVQLYQISGTLWHGRATAAIAGRTRIDAPAWAFHPRALLLGRIEYDLTGNLGPIPLSAIAGRGLGTPVYVKDSRIALPLNEVLRFMDLQDLGLNGRFQAEIVRLELRAQAIKSIDATLSVADVALGPPVNIQLGGATMRLESSDDVVKGVLKDSGGPLQADGILIYQPNGDYQFSLSLSARNPADTQLRQALRFVGTPNAAGKVSLNRRGHIDLASYL